VIKIGELARKTCNSD